MIIDLEFRMWIKNGPVDYELGKNKIERKRKQGTVEIEKNYSEMR